VNDASKPPSNPPVRVDVSRTTSDTERVTARVGRRSSEPPAEPAELEAEVRQLRQAVADLAADNRDLHNRLDRVISICERFVGGAFDGAGRAKATNGLRAAAGLFMRVARKAARGTVGTARRLGGARPAEKRPALAVEVELAQRPATRSPRMVVVARTAEDPERVTPSEVIAPQSDPRFDLVVWNEERSTAVLHPFDGDPRAFDAPDRSAVAAGTTAEVVADVGWSGTSLDPTWLERCRWALASESLPLRVRVSPARVGLPVGPVDWWAGLPASARGSRRTGLVKAIGIGGWGASADPDAPSSGSGVGRGYLASRSVTGTVRHRVSRIGNLVAAFPAPEDRPAVLMVASRRGFGAATWLLHALAENARFTVVVVDGSPEAAALRALTGLAPRVYPVGGFLEPAVWPSLIAGLARAHEVTAVIRVDAPVEVPRGENRPRVVDVPMSAAALADDADLVLALGKSIAESARERGLTAVELTAGPRLPGEMPAAEELAGVRAAYGVPDDARLVLAACELDVERRPEDVTAVARRLAGRHDIHVLLVGRGRLAGTVSDLAGYFALDRFTVAPPGHPLKQLVGACDCLLSTSEIDPWPESVAAALALGRCVVATRIDGVSELCEATGFDRCILCSPGDVGGLAAAVVECLDTQRAPRATRKAWNAAVKRSSQAARTVADALFPPARSEDEGGLR
jgi:glycosyltransferase involved in cell wall biosynthesis